MAKLRSRADWAVIRLGIGVSFLGLAGVLLVPVLGPLLVPGNGSLDRVAVAGWSAYAAATAMVTPYGALAAVRGKQAAVLGLRVAESVASIAGIGLLLAAGGSEFLVPAVLAVCALVSGLAIRMLLLTPEGSRRDGTFEDDRRRVEAVAHDDADAVTLIRRNPKDVPSRRCLLRCERSGEHLGAGPAVQAPGSSVLSVLQLDLRAGQGDRVVRLVGRRELDAQRPGPRCRRALAPDSGPT